MRENDEAFTYSELYDEKPTNNPYRFFTSSQLEQEIIKTIKHHPKELPERLKSLLNIKLLFYALEVKSSSSYENMSRYVYEASKNK